MRKILFVFFKLLLLFDVVNHVITAISNIHKLTLSPSAKKVINLKIVQKAKNAGNCLAKNMIESIISDVKQKLKKSNQTAFSIKRINKPHQESFYKKVDEENNIAFKLFQTLLKESPSSGWKLVYDKDGVTVERKAVKAGPFVSKEDALKGSKHACVRSSGIINCTTDSIFHLFQANELVPKYNEHVLQLKDVYQFNKPNTKQWTKITWSSGPKYGPMKARDFVSIVNYRRFGNGTYIILNRPAYHPEYPPSKKFVRATVLLAGSILEPYGIDSKQTKFTQIAQINPGGGADTPAIAWMINKLCAVSPPSFIRKLEITAQSLTRKKNIH